MYRSTLDWNSRCTTRYNHVSSWKRTRQRPSPWRWRRSSLTNSAGSLSSVLKASRSLHPLATNPRSRSSTIRGERTGSCRQRPAWTHCRAAPPSALRAPGSNERRERLAFRRTMPRRGSRDVGGTAVSSRFLPIAASAVPRAGDGRRSSRRPSSPTDAGAIPPGVNRSGGVLSSQGAPGLGAQAGGNMRGRDDATHRRETQERRSASFFACLREEQPHRPTPPVVSSPHDS